MTKFKPSAGQIFFAVTTILLAVVFFFSRPKFLEASNNALSIVLKIVPILVVVFIIMALINYFITPEIAKKHLGKKSGLKKWVIAVVGGILSTGPVYFWYPVLKDLQKKGVSNGFAAVFLYNRAVKPALLPMIIFYFGIGFTIALTLLTIIFSLFQGLVFEKILEVKK